MITKSIDEANKEKIKNIAVSSLKMIQYDFNEFL
jgi:hypothetical protein